MRVSVRLLAGEIPGPSKVLPVKAAVLDGCWLVKCKKDNRLDKWGFVGLVFTVDQSYDW